MTIQELYAKPQFAEADYETQQSFKKLYWRDFMSKDPRVVKLDPASQQGLFTRLMSDAPVLEGLGGISLTPEDRAAFEAGTAVPSSLTEYKRAAWLREKAAAGDPEATGDIMRYIAGKRVANETLLGQIILGSVDAIEEGFGQDKTPELARNKKNLSKVSSWLVSALKPQDAETVRGMTSLAAGAAGFTEAVALNTLLVGQAAAPGLLTKGLFSTLASRGAAAVTPFGKVALKQGLPLVAEAVGSGTVDVLRSLPELVNSGRISGDAKGFKNIAETFGEGVAWDLIFSGATQAMSLVARPLVKAMQKMDVTDEKSIRDVIAAYDPTKPEKMEAFLNDYFDGPEAKELVSQLPEDVQKQWYAKKQAFRTLRNVPYSDLSTPEGLKLFAQASLHDVEFDGKLINVMRNGEKVFEATSYPSAVSYMSDYLRKSTADTVIDDVLSAASRASAPDVVLKKTTTGKVDLTSLSDKTLINTLEPDLDGIISPQNAKVVAKVYARKLGYEPKIDVEVVPRDTFFQPGKLYVGSDPTRVYVPDFVRSPEEQKGFLKSFGRQLERTVTSTAESGGVANFKLKDKVLTNIQNLASLYDDKNALTPIALQAAVKKVGGQMDVVGNSIKLELPGNAPQTFANMSDANIELGRFAMREGLVTEDEFKAYLESTGRELRLEAQPDTGVTIYTVRRRDGSIEQRADTIVRLAELDPNYVPKLPAKLAPDMTLVDDTGKVAFSQAYASGPQKEMRQFLDNYTSFSKMWKTKNPVVVEALPDGSTISFKGKTSLSVEIPSIGFRKDFVDMAKAKRFIDKDIDQLATVEQVANAKGYRIDLTPAGLLQVTDSSGNTFIAKSKAELDALMKAAPDPSYQQNLVAVFGDEIDDELSAKAAKALQADPSRKEYDFVNEAKRTPMREWDAYAGSFILPMKSSMEKVARLVGDRKIFDIVRESDITRRQMFGAARKVETYLDKVMRIDGKQLTRTESSQLMKLMEIPEAKWAEAAEKLGLELTGEHYRVLNQTRALLNFYGKRFGVDMDAMLQDYAPKIRAFYLDMVKNPASRERYASFTKKDIINHVFAGRPDALQAMDFFAKHTRLEAFLTAADNKNIVSATQFYVEHGLRELYMAPYIDEAEKWLKTMRDRTDVNDADMAVIASYFESLTGHTSDPTRAILANRSLAASTYLAENIRKLKVVGGKNFADAIDNIADSVITTDIPSKLQSGITYATLGARPIRALQNMMQYTNTMAVFGPYADDAVKILAQDKDNKYIKEMFAKGLLNERIFASGAETVGVGKGLLERSLRGQQNVEYMTRAWTAKAAELAFDENFAQLAAGKIDFKRFARLTNMDFMSDAVIDTIGDFIAKGNPNAARDVFQEAAIRGLMFDYSKENYPRMFRGVMGRMFGKFGTYPVGMVDMYKNILGRGDIATKIVRGTRLIGLTTAVYEAFRLAGIDYSGFLFYDPFTFSGGPLYQTAQDMLNARDTGPEGAMARRNLARSWRLVVPFSTQSAKLIQAAESLSGGEVHKALVEATSSTYTPDNILTGITF